MKTRIMKNIITLMLMFVALPIMSQDCLHIYLNNGDFRKFYMKDITEMFISKYDADGVRHTDYDFQHITTLHNRYVYNLADVDSISFTKIDEESAQNNTAMGLETIFSAIAECDNLDEVEKNIDYIKQSEYVEKAYSDGHQLIVRFKGGEMMTFHLNHTDPVFLESNSQTKQRRINLSLQKSIIKPSNRQMKAVIANQQHYDEGRTHHITERFKPLESLFEKSLIETDYIDRPNINFFSEDIFKYDIIFLITHGGYVEVDGRMVHVLETGEEIGVVPVERWHDFITGDPRVWKESGFNTILKQKRSQYPDATDNHIYGHWQKEERNGKSSWVYYPIITESFIKDYAKADFQNPYSIFFNVACQSMQGDNMESCLSMANLFLEHGLGVYWGYNDANHRGQWAGFDYFCSLLNNNSVTTAYTNLHESLKVEYGTDELAVLHKVVNDNLDQVGSLFMLPIYSEPISHEKVMKDYLENDYVEVQATSTWYKPEMYHTQGFLYGENPNYLKEDEQSFSSYEIFNLGKGNHMFSAKLKNLEHNHKYYYCAYTFDGHSYNYGDTLSFFIDKFPDLQITTTSLTLKEGEQKLINITSGSGSYTLENDKEKAVTAFVDGDKIIINAIGVDIATITVTDNKTGQTDRITVTVTGSTPTPTDIPAEPMDLGLPSGTKWASYNVGATKPEEYGGYYSWGETEERDQYYFTTYSLCDGTVSSCHDIGENISGTEYDVAHVKWGGDWCMPTKDDFQELVYTCEYKETTRNGVKGYQFTGPNGKYIFLPYTGYYWNTENSNAGSEGCYWSATQTTSVSKAHEMSFKKDEVLWDCYINRFAGLSVRPVMHSTPTLADLTLSTTDPVTVVVDDKATIEITSGNGSYTAESDNEDVAIARVYDNASVIIKGVSVGTATITVTDTKSGQTATVAVTVTGTINPDVSPGEAIDLGLPSGTKWASCNVGATKPEEYGGYYAWGETEEKEVYNWSTYIHCDGSYSTCHDLGSDISGTEYDVAHVKWGGKWCMPTLDDILELLDNCTTEWTTLNGVNGRKFTSKINGNSIFLPAAGYRWYGDLGSAGGYGHYWSSTPYGGHYAYDLSFHSNSAYWLYTDRDDRRDGHSVRPVVRN